MPRGSSLRGDAGAGRRLAKERVKCALQRETSVLFFCAVCPKESHFLAILECTTPGRFQRRKVFWENEGFYFHPQIQHSGHFHSKPNEVYFFDISGNFELLGRPGQRLTFHPRSYRYQSFYLTRVDRKLPLIGEIQIMQSSNANVNNELFLTNIPIEIPETSSCVLS